jgi:hypothetical protein
MQVYPNKKAIREIMLDGPYVHEFELHVYHPKTYRDESFDSDGVVTLCTPALIISKWNTKPPENLVEEHLSGQPKTQDGSNASGEHRVDVDSPKAHS